MSNYSVKHISSQASNDHKDAQYFDSDKHSKYTVSANDIHAAADANVFTSDGLCFKRNATDTVMVCGLASAATASHVVVPARTSHLGLTVTALGKACFSHSRLKGITLPPTIEEICDNAFEASAIERLTLSSNIISLGKEVFADCSKLSEINLTSTRVRVIENKAFMNCGSLKKIQFPIGLQTIEDSAFENCISLDEVHLPESVKTLGNRVFHNCQSMSSFEGKSVTDIGEDAFGKCLSLSKIAACDYIEDNIHLIKDTALYQNANYNVAGVKVVLGSVIEVAQPKFALYSTPLPPNTKVIESFAFENFAGDMIELPKSIRLLKPHALVQKSYRKVMSENGNVKTVGGYKAIARVIYEGSIAGWNRIEKLRGDKTSSVVVTCEEDNVTFIDYI